MAVKTPAQLGTTLNANITDPTNKQNTAVRVREIIQDIIDSMLNSTVASVSVTANRVPKGTGTGINDGTWSFSTNDLIPVTGGSNLGGASNRIGSGFINTLNYATDLVFSEAGSEKGRFKTGGWFNIGVDSNAARLVVQGSGYLAATFTAKFQNSAGALSLQVRDDGSVYNLGAGSIATNTAFGLGALVANTTGFWNTANGVEALKANTTGVANTAFGNEALKTVTTTNSNSAFGFQALVVCVGRDNTGVGYQNSYNLSGGNFNSSFGSLAGYGITSGEYNIYVGHRSGYNSTTGSYNTAVGYNSLIAATGNVNCAFGMDALRDNTSGANNVALGYASLVLNATGARNVAVGNASGSYETGSDKLYIHNGLGGSTNTTQERERSLIYGIFDASVANQRLRINANVAIGGGAATATSTLNISNLPVSAAGLATGDVWNNGGVLTIV